MVRNRFQHKDTKEHKEHKGENDGIIIMEEIICNKIIGAAIEAHKHLGGPGLLEGIYEAALCQELYLRDIKYKRQEPVSVIYKGVEVKAPMIVDLLVENKIILEIKAVEDNLPIHKAQLLTYLRLSNLKLGLVINFGKALIKDGIGRVINGF